MRDHNGPFIADIQIVHLDSEWHVVKAMARLLHARGYRISPSRVLELPDVAPLDVAPADAAAVLVVWPVRRELFDKPALEARAASKRRRLVQVYAGFERPEETYDGPTGVDFSGWDFKSSGGRWDALMRRLRPLCGAPPKSQIDMVSAMPAIVLYSTMSLAIAAGVASLLQNRPDAPGQPLQPTTASSTPPALAPVIKSVAQEAETEVGRGGPVEYGYVNKKDDDDQGVELKPAHRAPPAPPPPEPPKRAPQGPDPF